MTMNDEDYFTDENLVDRAPTVHLSPSGRYRLEVRLYDTKPNCWGYSRGTVVREADGAVVATIDRNYSNFHHSFVTKEGREYLIAGRSYMGQTIVDLERGHEWNDPQHPDAYEGTEFCWAASSLSPDGRTLLVDGCHWACPYEYRFYDFTDPGQGWPDLLIRDADGEAMWLEAEDGRPPELRDDGTIACFETHRRFVPLARRGDEITKEEREAIDPAQWADASLWELVLDRRVILVREPDHMRIVEDWRSEDRKRRDREQAERDAAEDAMHEEWKRRCLVLAPLRAALAHHYLESSLWITTPTGASADRPAFTLHVKTESGVSARVSFGVDEGPLGVELCGLGEPQSLEHGRHEEGARQAAAAIKRYLAR